MSWNWKILKTLHIQGFQKKAKFGYPKFNANFNATSHCYSYKCMILIPIGSFQIVEEARINAIWATFKPSDLEAARRHQSDCEKRNKKSWKTSLFSWLKRNKSTKQQINSATVSTARPGHVSGPISRTMDVKNAAGRIKPRGSISGPLSGLFSSSRTEDHELPYMNLRKANCPQQVHPYGPVYLVT